MLFSPSRRDVTNAVLPRTFRTALTAAVALSAVAVALPVQAQTSKRSAPSSASRSTAERADRAESRSRPSEGETDRRRRARPSTEARARDGERESRPTSRAAASTTRSRREHKVEDGQTLWSIARRYGVSVDAIKEANGLDDNNIRPGRTLRVPAAATAHAVAAAERDEAHEERAARPAARRATATAAAAEKKEERAERPARTASRTESARSESARSASRSESARTESARTESSRAEGRSARSTREAADEREESAPAAASRTRRAARPEREERTATAETRKRPESESRTASRPAARERTETRESAAPTERRSLRVLGTRVERARGVATAVMGERRLMIPVVGIRPDQLRNSYDESRSEGRIHDAIDIHAPRGTPVVAVADGRILRFHEGARGGKSIYLLDEDGRTRYYFAHLDSYAEGLSEGSRVRRGDVIGFVGDTGNAQKGDYHLHFSISTLSTLGRWWQGENMNPYPLLRNGEMADR